MILFQLIKLTSLRYSVSLFIPCDNFNCQRFRAVRCLICHLYDGFTLLLLLPEFFRVFSSRAKLYGFCYLTLSLPNVSKGKFRPNFQISFCKILTNKYHHVYVQAESFHLNGHIIGFGPQTQKLKSPYKTPSNALAVKGLNVTKITNFLDMK